MLSFLRRNAGSWVLKAVLIGVALSFLIGFGPSSYRRIMNRTRGGGMSADIVAKVGPVNIDRTEFLDRLEQVKRNYAQMGLAQNPEIFNSPMFMHSVLASLVEGTILSLSAKGMGMSASDEEVAQYINRSGFFMEQGRFNRERFMNYLRKSGLTLNDYEESIRFKISGEKLRNLLRNSVFMSDEEIWQNYVKDNEKISLDAIKVPLDTVSFDPQNLRDEELKAVYDKNPESFKIPEKRKLDYISLDEKDFLGKAKITDEEIQKYYDLHKDEFKSKGTDQQPGEAKPLAEVSDMIKLTLDAEAAREAMDKEITRIYGEMTSQTDLKAYAEKNHLEIMSTPYFTNAGEVPGIENGDKLTPTAFAMSPKEISKPFEGRTREYIFQLSEVKPSVVPTFEDAKEAVREQVAAQKKKELLKEKADKFLASLSEGKMTMTQAASELKTEVIKTGEFTAKSYSIPELGAVRNLAEVAFAVPDGKQFPKEPVEYADGMILFRVAQRVMPEKADLEKDKEQFMKRALEDKSERFLAEWVEARRAVYPTIENQEFWAKFANAP